MNNSIISIISIIISINMMTAKMLRNKKLEFRFDTGSGAALIRSKEEVILPVIIIIIFVMKIMMMMIIR